MRERFIGSYGVFGVDCQVEPDFIAVAILAVDPDLDLEGRWVRLEGESGAIFIALIPESHDGLDVKLKVRT